MIRLATAIFHNPNGATKPDPIIYLSGGPGGSALEFAYLAYDQQVTPLFPSGRDVILFDQRGVGLSKPALDCPAASDLEIQLLSQVQNGKLLSKQEQYDLILKAFQDCQKTLSGVAKLSAYNSASNAADVNDLGKALGYDKVNLWGISYGTRLALETMRDYPQGIRSVILDSVYPPQVNIVTEGPADAMRAFNTLFDGCAADKACNASYPDLKTVFFDTADRLAKQPVKVTATDPLSNKSYDVLLDSDTYLSMIFEMFYQTDMIPSLPQIIYDAKNGDYSQIADYAGLVIAEDSSMSPGMQYSVECNEEHSFTSYAAYQAAIAAVPQLAGMYSDSTKLDFAVCDLWGAGKAAQAEDQAISSTIPTLVMAGEYDPITPPAWAKMAAQTLPNSYFFQYPGMGHGTSVDNPCPTSMLIAFVNNPTSAPNNACIATMGEPKFITPASAGDITLDPYTNTQAGITGVAPRGWREVAPGTVVREQSSLDQTALLQIAGTGSTSTQAATSLLPQLGVAKLPPSTGTYKTANLTWKLYRADSTVQGQNLSMVFALADQGGKAYVVLLLTTPGDIEALNKAVFMPALDALKSTQ